MTTATSPDTPSGVAKPAARFQFRIRDLFIATLLVALLLAGIVERNLWLLLVWFVACTACLMFRWRCTLVEVLVVMSLAGILAALLLPALSFSNVAARAFQCRCNLGQIGRALHAYHDQYGSFPPAYIADNSGKPVHSWRVLILPFMQRKDICDIYDQYRFDEPWDGPNNRKLAQRIKHFDVYRCPEDHDRRTSPETSYVAVGGPDTAWPGEQSTNLSDLKDGASNVLLVVEVHDSGIHWMEPRDFHVTQMAPGINPKRGQGISGRHGSGKEFGAMVLYADGRVDYLPPDADPAVIESRLRTSDGTIKLENN